MVQRLRHRAQGQEGFTLIELLVVILIIGILAAVAIPVFLNQTGKANAANVKSDINSAATAEETYFTDNQAYLAATPATPSSYAPLTTINPALSNAFTVASATSGEGMTITLSGSGSTGGYAITADDPTAGTGGVSYTYTKAASTGQITRSCVVPANVNPGGCKASGGGSLSTSTASQNGTW